MAGRQVTIQFLGDAKGLVNATSVAGKSTSSLSTRFKQLGKTAAIGAGAATVVLAKGLWDATEAAVADEAAAKKLATQLKNTTGATDAQVKSVEDWITKTSLASGIADDDLRPALGKLAAITGDVSKGQHLVNLAMDVAAQNGVSLESVTKTLVGAENGRVAGLGKYQVKTKDAAGATRDLDDILGDLSKKTSGAAAKAANTTAGKFQRLKVEMSETAESIGYKLLPYANDLGDWLLKEGVPAAEDMAGTLKNELEPHVQALAKFVRANKDDWIELGKGIARDALPVLETTGHVLGDVAGVLGDLPDPVKKFGIEALIASRFVGTMNSSLTSGRSYLQDFGTGATDAEKKVSKLKSGVHAAAGVGGMLLLADSTSRTSDALGILEGAAGGALAGSAAGPWGAVIGGALGGGMALLSRTTDKAKDSMVEAKPPAIEYANSLDQVTGAARGSTRELIRLDLQQQGAFKSAGELGVSSRDLVKYLMGNEGAIHRVNKAMKNASGELMVWTDNYGVVHSTLTGQQKDLTILKGALGQVSSSMKRSTADTLFNSLTTKDMAQVQHQLAKEYNLTPREVKTAIKQTGAVSSAQDAQHLIDKLEYLRKHPHVDIGITTHMNTVKGHDDIGGISGRIGAGFAASQGGRADFAASFKDFQSSIFGASSPDGGPLTLDSLLTFSEQQRQQADQTKVDLAKLQTLGLSAAIVKQLQGSGAQGLEALHVLSGASAAQIGFINSQNALTGAAYGGAGNIAAGMAFGYAGPAIGAASGALGPRGDKGHRVEIKIMTLDSKKAGRSVVEALREYERETGVKLLVSPG